MMVHGTVMQFNKSITGQIKIIFLMGRNGHGDVCILGSNGNVGMGTSSPAYSLDVNGAIRNQNGT